MPMQNIGFQIDATTTATATTNARLDKRVKKSNWNDTMGTVGSTDVQSAVTMGLLDVSMDMDIDLASIVNAAPTQTVNNNNATLLQLSNTATTTTTGTTTTTTTTTTPAEIDFVYVMENPLPPSPPPSADISSDEQSPRLLHSIDPFEMLHEAGTHTHSHTFSTLEACSKGALCVSAPPRYETRRVVS